MIRYRVLRSFGSVLIVAALATGCELFNAGTQKNIRTSQTDLGITTGPGSVGIKTAQTLIASLEAVTGVSATSITTVDTPSGPDSSLPLSQQVALSMGFLSKSADLSALNSTHVLVATALGCAFAREQIKREAAQPAQQRLLCGDVNFTQRPSDALTDAVVGALIQKFSRRYVQRDPDPNEISTLKDCVAGVVTDVGNPGSSTANSIAIQQAINGCIACGYIGSADFLRQ